MSTPIPAPPNLAPIRERLDRAEAGAVNVLAHGVVGDGVASDSAAMQAAVDAAVAAGASTLYVPTRALRLATPLDARGLRVACNGTVLVGIINNHSGIENAVLNGYNLSRPVLHARPHVSRAASLIVAPQTADSVWVVAKKASPTTQQKYLLLAMVRKLVTGTDSEGGAQDLWRLGQVQDVNLAYVFFKGTPTLATTHASGTHAITTQTSSSSLLGPNGNGGKPYWRTQQQGDYVEWTGVQGPVIAIGTLTSATGAKMDVFVDGMLVGSFSNASTDAGKVRTFEMKTTGGPHTVRVQHADATAARNAYVIGVNFFEAGDAQAGSQYDNLWYGRNDTAYPGYITNNGANEYALYNADSATWAGSYHGGETQTVAPEWKLDGVATALAVGTFYAARSVTLDQQTTIAWAARPGDSFATRSRTTFHDSGLSFECSIAAAQAVSLRDAYTHMCKAAPTFTAISFPALVPDVTDSSDERYVDGFVVLGRTNRIVQREPSTGRTIESWFTLHPYEVTTRAGCSVLANAVEYRKVYYGLCQGARRAVRRAAWESVWLFN